MYSSRQLPVLIALSHTLKTQDRGQLTGHGGQYITLCACEQVSQYQIILLGCKGSAVRDTCLQILHYRALRK